MALCINRSSKEFQDLQKQTNMNPVILAAKISLWQDKHGIDNFPVVSDLITVKSIPVVTERVKAVLQKMKVNITTLHEYAKGNPDILSKDINAVADLSKKVIAVALGKEEVLTEEMVHIATAILEQTDPSLITSLISQVDKFKIYKTTLDRYKGNKNYQLSDGRPDIRKIKKEAVDKLIAEIIVNNSEGSEQYPELASPNVRNVLESWWHTILEFIRSLYGKSGIDLFKQVSEQILEGNIGTIEDLKAQGVYFNLEENTIGNNPEVDNLYNTITDIDSRMQLNPETPNDKRHYTFDGVRVAKSVTEKVKSGNKMPDRTEAEKFVDNMKREWGSEGHNYLEKYILTNLIDENGFKKEPTQEPITTTLDEDAVDKLNLFATTLINSYPDGTRFVIEKKVVNRNVKGMLASTIDFMAISPVEKEDGTKDMSVDILDWKFTDINKSYEEDIPWYKQKDWKPQMGEYTKIMYQYGLKPHQLKKARMIPFIMNYEYVVPGDAKSGLRPTSIEIGKLDSLTETNLYLMPVPINSETTGNEAIDDLLRKLRSRWEKLYTQKVAPELRSVKIAQINELSKAIRTLQVTLNFDPLVNVGNTFVKSSKAIIDEYKKINTKELTKEQIEAKLTDLLEFKANAENFTVLDSVFISQYGEDNLTKESEKTLRELKNISSTARAKLGEILDLQKRFVADIAERENFINENNKTSFFNPEREITGIVKNFIEGSRLPAKLINFASNLIMKVNRLADKKFVDKFDEYSKLLTPLEKEAETKGVSAFSMIGTTTSNGLKLIRKVDVQFWKDVTKAKEEGNKDFFKKNMDMDKFNELAKKAIEKGEAEFNLMQFHTDSEKDSYIRKKRITALKNSIDINRKDFNGYNDYTFSHIFSQAVNIEEHLSDEYRKMAQSPNALAVWQFLTDLNTHAKDLGYIDKQGMSFFPLVEASIVDKFKQTNNFGTEFMDFMKDLYTVKTAEEQQFSKTDVETGEVKKVIPKYFTTAGNMAVNKLSTDLNKVGALWIKSLMDYESKQSIESSLQTVLAIEKAKGQLAVDENGNLITEGGKFKVLKDVNKNANIMETIINDALYDLESDLGSLGNISIKNIAQKTTKDQESGISREVNIKKGLQNLDTLTRSLAVGLKPLIGIANWAGYNFHAAIKGGNMYTYSEFIKNNASLSGSLSIENKALLHLLSAGSNNVMDEMRRKAAKEKGLGAYLSTWSFTDVMMITNSFPERKLELANMLSFNDNAIIIDGQIHNARQFLRRQDRKNRVGMSYEERQNLEKTFDERVKQLISNSTKLTDVVKIADDKISLEGISDEEFVKYSLKVSEFNRTLNGSMNEDNKAGYRRDAIFSSFMMFKNWIPKLTLERFGNIKFNYETEEWEYGRMRAFAKTVASLGWKNISKMRDIINGTPEGIAILEKMIADKRIEHFHKTGQELEISDEEFFDLMRTALSNEAKELGMLITTLGMVCTISFMEPPEDATNDEKNRWKFWAKMFNKIHEELSFYYNPISMQSITKGSILPSLGILGKSWKVIEAFSKESYGVVVGNEELVDKTYPTKYFLNLIPGLAQFQNDYLPYIDADLAKEMGIRVTAEARRE